jgi:hypothetical protein
MFDFVNLGGAKLFGGILTVVTAAILFGSLLARARPASPTFWPWLRRTVEASVGALLFVGTVGAFSWLLAYTSEVFSSIHDAALQSSLSDVRALWGQPVLQRELEVNHFVEVVEREEIPREDPEATPQYRDVKVRKLVPQNGIVASRGRVNVQFSEPEKPEQGFALYNTYVLDTRYEYEVVNDSDLETEAEFEFPLSSVLVLYKDFGVTVDGQDISPRLRFSADGVSWTHSMMPGQQVQVVMTYTTRGMESYYYEIPTQREIRNLALTVTLDIGGFYVITKPETEQTRAEVRSHDGKSTIRWQFDGVIMAPSLGVAAYQPKRSYAPYEKITRLLGVGSDVLVLIASVVALTLLIQGEPVRLSRLVLLCAAYCAQPLVLAGLSDGLGLWGTFALGVLLSGLLVFLVFRDLSSILVRVLLYTIIGFFVLGYPLARFFITDAVQYSSFEIGVWIGLILYLFGFSLYTRAISKRPSS